MKPLFFWGGAALVLAGTGGPLILPQAPAAIQSNPVLQPIGTFLIDNGGWLALIGLVLMIIGVFIR